MNLVDIIDPECGLQQDEWSQGRPRFGQENQLEVIGWSCRNKIGVKYYIVECDKCRQDAELFGDGCFRCLKGQLGSGVIPCGCSSQVCWSMEQYATLCRRKSVELGYTFIGFDGEWRNRTTKIKMFCEKHGVWVSGTIINLVNLGQGCPGCGNDATTKPDDVMISSFIASGCFHPDTKFWRSERKTSRGKRSYWHMFCPECGEQGEAFCGCLQKGNRPCACSRNRQQQAYINWVVDENNQALALKLGIATNSSRRVTQQNNRSTYEIRNHSIYIFPDVSSCKAAERECKQTFVCGILTKEEMPDGYTETTDVLNLVKIKQIYEKHGGVKLLNKET